MFWNVHLSNFPKWLWSITPFSPSNSSVPIFPSADSFVYMLLTRVLHLVSCWSFPALWFLDHTGFLKEGEGSDHNPPNPPTHLTHQSICQCIWLDDIDSLYGSILQSHKEFKPAVLKSRNCVLQAREWDSWFGVPTSHIPNYYISNLPNDIWAWYFQHVEEKISS